MGLSTNLWRMRGPSNSESIYSSVCCSGCEPKHRAGQDGRPRRQAGRSRGARRADRPGWVGEACREEGAGPPRRESLRGLRQLVCRELARGPVPAPHLPGQREGGLGEESGGGRGWAPGRVWERDLLSGWGVCWGPARGLGWWAESRHTPSWTGSSSPVEPTVGVML